MDFCLVRGQRRMRGIRDTLAQRVRSGETDAWAAMSAPTAPPQRRAETTRRHLGSAWRQFPKGEGGAGGADESVEKPEQRRRRRLKKTEE